MPVYRFGDNPVQSNSALPSENSAIRWWPKAIALLGAVLLAAAAAIALLHPAMLVSPHDEINGAVHIYAGYLAARNLALALLLFVSLALGAKHLLNNLLLLVGLIQLLDAIIDAFEGRWPIVPGVAVLAVLFFAASASICGSPFWMIQAWKQPD